MECFEFIISFEQVKILLQNMHGINFKLPHAISDGVTSFLSYTLELYGDQ